jgi:lipopolysaccharide export LptBFGC system permease protein LptF
MESFLNFPRLVFLISFLALWLAAWIGVQLNRRSRKLDEDARADFGVIQGATLTLLGLIIGFSFSMAIGRYDQRKIYEEEEANAIGTEYVRADLLPVTDAAQVRDLLRRYTDLRIAFYETRDQDELKKIAEQRASTQDQLWKAVSRPANAQPSPVIALAVAGMNDVLNSQGYTQAAWWNRIPEAAWSLMFFIAIFANLMLGYGIRHLQPALLVVLPLVVSISFFLIADIDSPRRGIIRVHPQNLESLRLSLH